MMSGCFSSCVRYSLSVSARSHRAEKPERRSSEATISKSASWSSRIKAKRGLGTSGSGHTSLIERKGKDITKKTIRIMPKWTLAQAGRYVLPMEDPHSPKRQKDQSISQRRKDAKKTLFIFASSEESVGH